MLYAGKSAQDSRTGHLRMIRPPQPPSGLKNTQNLNAKGHNLPTTKYHRPHFDAQSKAARSERDILPKIRSMI